MQTAQISEEVRRYIAEEFLDGDDQDLEVNSPLLEWGIVDSVGMTKLVAFLEERFGIRIAQSEITPSNFRDVERISSMVQAHTARPPEAAAQEAEADPELAELLDFGAKCTFVRLDSGALIHTIEMAGDEPTWVLLPEPGDGATSFGDVQRALEGHNRSLAVDLVGFGMSSGPSEEPTYWDHVGLLAELLRKDSGRSYVLVGHGLSAAVALDVARRAPEQVACVVALGFGLVSSLDALLSPPGATAADFLACRRRSQPVTKHQLAATAARLATPAFERFVGDDVRHALVTTLASAVTPTLFIGALEDRLVPRAAVEAAAQATPGAQVKWLARAGHAFPRERADETVSLMRGFVETLG